MTPSNLIPAPAISALNESIDRNNIRQRKAVLQQRINKVMIPKVQGSPHSNHSGSSVQSSHSRKVPIKAGRNMPFNSDNKQGKIILKGSQIKMTSAFSSSVYNHSNKANFMFGHPGVITSTEGSHLASPAEESTRVPLPADIVSHLRNRRKPHKTITGFAPVVANHKLGAYHSSSSPD